MPVNVGGVRRSNNDENDGSIGGRTTTSTTSSGVGSTIPKTSLFDHFGPTGPRDKRFGCCCGCCHVKQGAFILGIFELFVDILLLAFVINRLGNTADTNNENNNGRPVTIVDVAKPRGADEIGGRLTGGISLSGDPDTKLCSNASFLSSCTSNGKKEETRSIIDDSYRISEFSQSVTVIGNYITSSLLVLWLFVVILLFYAIFNKHPGCLIPHLILQALTLLFSVVYFILFAWDYFYVELYVERSEVIWPALAARLWLLSIYGLVAITQLYIFTAVLKCYAYLKDYRLRQYQFEAVGDSV